MSALTIIEDLERAGVSLWADGNDIRYEGDMSVITASTIKQLKILKQDVLKILNHPKYDDSLIPAEWKVALSILDTIIQDTDNQVLRRDWNNHFTLSLALSDWEAQSLEQGLRFNQHIYFNKMLDIVERTTPEYETKALDFIMWAESKGIKHKFFIIPTGLINDGHNRHLPSNTVEGLDSYMINYPSRKKT